MATGHVCGKSSIGERSIYRQNDIDKINSTRNKFKSSFSLLGGTYLKSNVSL
jgi:hypothetical protein